MINNIKKTGSPKAYSKKVIDSFDGHYSQHIVPRNRRWNLSYKMYQGIIEDIHKYTSADFFSPDTIYNECATHYDIVSPLIKKSVGDDFKGQIKPIVHDTSLKAKSLRRHKQEELVMQYISTIIVPGIEKQATQQYLQEFGVQDQFSLSPEQIQQAESDIKNRSGQMTPDAIKEIMSGYKVPSERKHQMLLEFLYNELNIEFTEMQLIEDLYNTSTAWTEIKSGNLHPIYKRIDPREMWVFMSTDSPFTHNAEIIKRQRIRTCSEIYEDYWRELKMGKVYKDFSKRQEEIKDKYHDSDRTLLDLHTDGIINLDEINQRTDEGAAEMRFLRSLYGGHPLSTEEEIEEVSCQWKVPRKFKLITRKLKDGTHREFWQAHNYEFNKYKGDVESKVVSIPWIYGAKKLNFSEPQYVELGPLKNQYRSINNPFDVYYDYMGVVMNYQMAERDYNQVCTTNTYTIAPMDRVKPLQLEVNIIKDYLQKIKKTSWGNMILLNKAVKPDDMKDENWLAFMKKHRVILTDYSLEGANQYESNSVRAVNVHNPSESIEVTNYLIYLESQVAKVLGLNPSSLGQASPYTGVRTNAQNIEISNSINETFKYTTNLFFEKCLNRLLNVSKYHYKNKEDTISYILDDAGMAQLKIDSDITDNFDMTIFVSKNIKDKILVKEMKQYIQPFIQNGMHLPEVLNLALADNKSEIIAVAKAVEDKIMRAEQQAQQAQQEQFQSMQEWEKEKFFTEQNMKLQEATIKADDERRGNDVNQNNEDDKKEIEFMKIQASLQEQMNELQFQREELLALDQRTDKDREVKKQENVIKKKQTKAKTNFK